MSLPVRISAGVGVAALAAAALALGPASGAHALPGAGTSTHPATAAGAHRSTTARPATRTYADTGDGSDGGTGLVSLNVNPRVQEQDEWCWAATGSAVAEYMGQNVSQNEFCDLATGNPTDAQCANTQGDISMVQNAYSQLGINPGEEVDSPLDFSTVENEINAQRPMLARIQWSAGGGHFLIVEGMDPDAQTVQWIDPWPDDSRVSVADYSQFASNADFTWTHSLDSIGAS